MKCRHCGKEIEPVSWSNGPGWRHVGSSRSVCAHLYATPEVVHLIAVGEAVTSCCGRPPFELPRTERITVDKTLANCEGASTTEEHS